MADRERTGAALVLHVIATPRGRGALHAARSLIDRIDEPGVVHHRLLTLFDGNGEFGTEQRGIDLSLGEPGGNHVSEGFKPRVALRFRREVARLKPVAVVAHGGDPMKYSVPAVIGTKVPLIFCVVGTYMGQPAPVHEWVWRRLMNRANIVVAVGDEVLDECIERFHVPPARAVTILNGRDPSEYRPRSRSPRAPSGDPTLIFVGALTSQKQPDRFVDMVRSLRSEGRAFRAVIVGDGPLASTLAAVAPAHGIELLGHRSDVPELLRRSDVFVFPSRPPEGLPGVLIEAGLSGLPTVSTPVPGASTVISEGQTGMIVEDSVPALAAAVRTLLDDPERRAAMGEAARRRCESNFTLDVMAERWRDLFRTWLVVPEYSRNQLRSIPETN